MQALIDELLAFPTVVFTVVAGLSTLYWLFVSLTGLDVFEGAEGAIDGAIDGAAESAGEAVGEGLLDGAADGVDVDSVGLGSVLHALNLRDVPTTMALSIVSLSSWMLCALSMRYLAPLAPDAVPAWLVGLVVAVASLALALPISGAIAKPFAPLFRTQEAGRNTHLVGQSAIVRSSAIAPGASGQAEVATRGASMLIDVRSDAPGTLRRGDSVLLVDYDAAQNTYAIEPMSRLLGADRSEAPAHAAARVESAAVAEAEHVTEATAPRGGGTPM